MNLYDIDWQDFLNRAAIWSGLSLPAREAFLALRGGAQSLPAPFGDDLQKLVENSFLEPSANGQHFRVYPSCRPFATSVRAMVRINIHGDPPCEASRYLSEVFTRDEVAALVPGYHSYASVYELSQAVSSIGWLKSFLAAPDVASWESERTRRADSLLPKQVAEVTRSLVHGFADHAGPVSFAEIGRAALDLPNELLAQAIRTAIRFGLLFPGMNDDRTPVLGLFPAVAERLKLPQPGPPSPIDVDREFHAALILEDLTTLLVAAATEPLPLRSSDSGFFAKVVKQLQPDLIKAPDWVADYFAVRDPEYRLTQMQQIAYNLKLATHDRKGKATFRITAAGQRWLTRSPSERLKDIVSDFKRDVRQQFLSRADYYDVKRRETHVPEFYLAMLEAWRWCAEQSAFVELDRFCHWQAVTTNPYLTCTAANRPARMRQTYGTPTQEDNERHWFEDLHFFAFVLVQTGGARIAMLDNSDSPYLRITGIGRYLLELADDFDYGPAEQGDIVVQPNFDVVFLSSSPLAEATIARFAERQGSGVGNLFKLTRKSVVHAAASGMTGDQVLETLGRLSSKALPPNVEREIRGWFGHCRTVAMKTAILIDCGDAETASRVIAACRKQARLLTETIVEVTDAKGKQSVIKKLRAASIFIANPAATKSPK